MRGVDGEKETATRMLISWKEKHNITDKELNSSSLKNSSEFYNMSAEEFLKHIEVDIRMLGISIFIFGLGKIFRNDNISDAGMSLFKESVKKLKEQQKQSQKQQ